MYSVLWTHCELINSAASIGRKEGGERDGGKSGFPCGTVPYQSSDATEIDRLILLNFKTVKALREDTGSWLASIVAIFCGKDYLHASNFFYHHL